MKEISYTELNINPMTLIGGEWMLLTAGTREHGYNTMTCSWGHLGAIWGHGGGYPTSVCYVRPQRYTKEFVDREELFTISVFPEQYKKDLGYLGVVSGRDKDKVAATNLTPVFADDTTYFAQAKLVLICRKLYRGTLKEEGFVDKSILADHYPNRDLHDMYIGEIVKVLVAD